jgi:hypothetical protein
MANPSVDKLKALAIRHGEKAVVGLTATICVVFIVLAVLNPTLEMKPEELQASATSAQSNLGVKQADKDILAKLEKDGLKEPDFQKMIEGQIANALKPDPYRARLDWVTPEPGAGLIRDQPELIAPTDLTAFPGRGGILMFALDPTTGERVIDPGDPKTKNGPRGGLALGGPEGPGNPNSKTKKETPEEKERRLAKEARDKAIYAGDVKPADKKDQPDAEAAPAGPYKEEVKGKRWVVLTAVLDNAKLKKNYLQALKNEAVAYPNFKRVDIERQTLQTDGTSWSEWTAVAMEKNWEVLDNLPEYDTEFVPENQRPKNLVDALPFLKAGYWTGVHVAKLVPADIRNKPAAGSNNGPGATSMQGPGAGGPKGLGGPGGGGRPGNSGMMAAAGGGKGGPGMAAAPGGAGGASTDDMSFDKYDEATLMIRSLDFTVEQDQTYRFRIRIVVVNPNYNRTDVNPGVDVETKQLYGPWSEPSPIVSVPADVVAYAQAPDDAERRDDLVTFQVVRWDPVSGQTVIKTDARGPGQIIGEYGSVPVPSSEGKGPKSEKIDFNSRSIVLDTYGGRQKLPDIPGIPRNQFDVPALAMIVEPNGDVTIRSQAFDRSDEVRQDMETNYKLALEDSNEARKKSDKTRNGGKGRGRGGKKGGGPGNSGMRGGANSGSRQ